VATRLKAVAATAKIADGPLFLKSLTLTGGSDAATVLVQDTAAGGGTDVIKLAAAAGVVANWVSGDADGVLFSVGLYVTVAGTTPSVCAEYEV